MKKFIVLGIFSLILSSNAFGQIKFGAGVSLQVADLFGVGGRAHYTINEKFAAQAGVNIWLEEFFDYSIDLDAYYQGFDIGDLEGFSLTPFAGLNIARYSVLGFGDTQVGLNIGLQGLLSLTGSLDLYIEPKLVIGGLDGFYISGGVYFGGGN